MIPAFSFLQVRLRFQDLMKLFHSASQKSTSCTSEGELASSEGAVPDHLQGGLS